MTRLAIVTVTTRNYLHYALALAESARIHHPEADFHICLADRPLESCGSDFADCQTFLAEELAIPNWKRFAFQYTPFELCCALKPFAFQRVLEQGYDQVIYLDGDMRLFAPLDEVVHGLEHHSMLLTPHLLKPLPRDGARPDEDLFLMAGTYNAGFVALRSDETAEAFLQWWSERLESDCYKDISASIFVDQKWLSLAPGLFPNIGLIRNPGYNTGHWTLPQFPLSLDSEGQACIGGRRIALFHFSNLSPNNLDEFELCQNRFAMRDLPVLQKLVAEQHLAIRRHDSRGFANWGCAYNTMSDGSKIHPAWREAVRRGHPSVAEIADPFDVMAAPGLLSKFAALEPKARKWRRDWRLKGVPQTTPTQPRTKQLERRVKSWLESIGLRKKKKAA